MWLFCLGVYLGYMLKDSTLFFRENGLFFIFSKPKVLILFFPSFLFFLFFFRGEKQKRGAKKHIYSYFYGRQMKWHLMGKVTLFKLWVNDVNLNLTISGFTIIIPNHYSNTYITCWPRLPLNRWGLAHEIFIWEVE